MNASVASFHSSYLAPVSVQELTHTFYFTPTREIPDRDATSPYQENLVITSTSPYENNSLQINGISQLIETCKACESEDEIIRAVKSHTIPGILSIEWNKDVYDPENYESLQEYNHQQSLVVQKSLGVMRSAIKSGQISLQDACESLWGQNQNGINPAAAVTEYAKSISYQTCIDGAVWYHPK